VNEFETFARDLLRLAPEVGARMRAMGDDVTPDLEIPVAWMGSVGSAIGNVFSDLSPDVSREVFALIERHLASGSELMRTAVTTGLLESVASAVSGGRVRGPELAEVLGPRSREYVDAWDNYSLGRSSLVDPP
jgi:hypothetical protein